MSRKSITLAGFAFAALAFAAPAQAQTGRFQTDNAVQFHVQRGAETAIGPQTVAQPRFMAWPASIYANDETGRDWLGSDEVYAIFRDPATGAGVYTPEWGDVDTGETRYFAQANACLTPIGETYTGGDGRPIAWRCREGGIAGPFSFIVELWEADASWTPSACLGPIPGQTHVGPHRCADDQIARYEIAYNAAELLAAMPYVGALHTEHVRRGGYTFTWRVQRLPDVMVPQQQFEVLR